MSADSMLRTTCFAWRSLAVSTWISLISPSGVTMTRADNTPVRLVIRFSARFTPHGSGPGSPSPNGPVTLDDVTSALPGCDSIAALLLGAIQRAVGGDQHVLLVRPRTCFGDPNANRHEPRRIAQPLPECLDVGAHLHRDG